MGEVDNHQTKLQLTEKFFLTMTCIIHAVGFSLSLPNNSANHVSFLSLFPSKYCIASNRTVGGRGDKEDDDEMAMTTNRAMETPQWHGNQPACKGQEVPAEDGRLKRGGGDKSRGGNHKKNH